MGLFSRRKPPQDLARIQAEAIDAFWSWWRAEGSGATAQALAAREPERMVDALSRRVDAISSGLAWELGAGSPGHEHVLVVSPEGDPALRAVARRWRLAAPDPDATWEYADARQPAPDGDFTLRLDGVEIDAAQVQVTARVDGPRVHVVVHHASFERLPEKAKASAAFLLVDATLGETAVETWVGDLSTSHLPPLDPVPLAGLTAVVEHLQSRYTDGAGNPTWGLLRGELPDGTPLVASTQVPLLAVTAPHLDTHVAVSIGYADRTPQGLPADGSLEALRGFEEHLAERLGGSGQLVAHETSGGTRVLHFYVDGATPVAAQVEAAVGAWSQGPVAVRAQPDPGWEGVAHLRV